MRPVALGFQTEHPCGPLPAITHLAARRRPARGVASLRTGKQNGRDETKIDGKGNDIPALAAPCAAAIGADIEAAPVVSGDNRRGRLDVRTGRKIGGRCAYCADSKYESCKNGSVHERVPRREAPPHHISGNQNNLFDRAAGICIKRATPVIIQATPPRPTGKPQRKRVTLDAGSATGSSISGAGLSIAATTSMPRVWQMLASPAGSGASVTKVWIWLIWAMRTRALRRSFVESATSITLRALAMIACAACTSR